MKAYACDTCGNIVEVIRGGAVIPLCCGTSMRIILPNSNDAASTEKHVPVYSREENKVVVRVGEKDHPNIPEHYIEWIEIETPRSIQRKYLKPYDTPLATFYLEDESEEILNIFAYCNVHGLWCNKGKEVK